MYKLEDNGGSYPQLLCGSHFIDKQDKGIASILIFVFLFNIYNFDCDWCYRYPALRYGVLHITIKC